LVAEAGISRDKFVFNKQLKFEYGKNTITGFMIAKNSAASLVDV
jgi:hypothetical protein